MEETTNQVQIVLIEDEKPDFSERTFCLECGSWDVGEDHECNEDVRQAA